MQSRQERGTKKHPISTRQLLIPVVRFYIYSCHSGQFITGRMQTDQRTRTCGQFPLSHFISHACLRSVGGKQSHLEGWYSWKKEKKKEKGKHGGWNRHRHKKKDQSLRVRVFLLGGDRCFFFVFFYQQTTREISIPAAMSWKKKQ